MFWVRKAEREDGFLKIKKHQKEKGRKYMGQKIYFNFVNVRKYLRENKETGKRAVVSVTNRNALSVERHMELLNLNDEKHIYLACVEDNLL
ncbi:hypothetical protein D7V90_01850 [bacterium 1xD42-87]|nr:hypothetical protein D7V90_01850 [bacterium 1xD42-87]